jgi:hypothetical protein
VSDVIWSDDGDLFLREPEILRQCPAAGKELALGTDGSTDATGKVFDSASYTDWTAAGVDIGEDSEAAACTHFLEITSGVYQGFYRIATLEGTDDADWDDEDFHSRAERKLRDLCVARVLAGIYRGAARTKDDICWVKAEYWSQQERRVFGELGELELDDGNTEVDSRTQNLGGSVEIGVS